MNQLVHVNYLTRQKKIHNLRNDLKKAVTGNINDMTY